MGKLNLNFLSDERIKKLREKEISEGIDSLKGKISGMEIETKTERHVPEVPQAPARYDQEQLSELARKIYRTNIKPVEQIDEAKEKAKEVANTYAARVNARSLAKSLIGLRNGGNEGTTTERTPNGNGDLGNYSPPADPNGGGNLGVNNAYGQYPALTTAMSLEQYEEHIAKQFFASEPEEVEEVVEEEVFNEDAAAIAELEEALTQMEDLSWQSIDKEMRGIASDHGMTPKELHKEFKAKHGMIPDDWAKENQVTEECGWMPLEEAVALNKVGSVYEVSMMWRGHTRRLKFFWPQVGTPSKDDMQKACDAFYPGCRLLAFYPSMDLGDNKDNYMVVVAPSAPNSIALKKEDWEVMTDEESLAYEIICEEEGEPISPPLITDEGVQLWIEDHNTGEERVVMINEISGRLSGLAMRERGKRAKAAKRAGDTEGYNKNMEKREVNRLLHDDRVNRDTERKYGDKTNYMKDDVNTHYKINPLAYQTDDVVIWEGKRGLWDNIHAKRKRGEKPAKPGDKNYPKTLNVEGKNPCWDGYKRKPGTKKFEKGSCVKEGKTPIEAALETDKKLMKLHQKDKKAPKDYVKEGDGDVTGHGSRLDTAYHYDMQDAGVTSGDIKNRMIKGPKRKGKIKKEEYVYEDDMKGMSVSSGDKRSTESGAGLTAKGVAKYRRNNPGSKLKTAVTTPPSQLKAGSKAANRRKSFCARSRGWNGERGKAARRRWNC